MLERGEGTLLPWRLRYSDSLASPIVGAGVGSCRRVTVRFERRRVAGGCLSGTGRGGDSVERA